MNTWLVDYDRRGNVTSRDLRDVAAVPEMPLDGDEIDMDQHVGLMWRDSAGLAWELIRADKGNEGRVRIPRYDAV